MMGIKWEIEVESVTDGVTASLAVRGVMLTQFSTKLPNLSLPEIGTHAVHVLGHRFIHRRHSSSVNVPPCANGSRCRPTSIATWTRSAVGFKSHSKQSGDSPSILAPSRHPVHHVGGVGGNDARATPIPALEPLNFPVVVGCAVKRCSVVEGVDTRWE
jgi:hypothetical protein